MRCVSWRIGVIAGLALSPPVRAAEKAAAEVLSEKGLIKAGAVFVVQEEKDLSKKIAATTLLKKKVFDANRKLEQAENRSHDAKKQIRRFTQERLQLNGQLPRANSVEQHNQIVSRINQLTDKINLLREESESSDAAKGPRAEAAKAREQYLELVLELRKLADVAKTKYDVLANDDGIKSALAKLNEEEEKEYTLGPARAFNSNLRTLEKLESAVLTEAIPLRHEGGVYSLDVSLNGKTPVSMMFDTGASLISLPAAMAAKAGLNPSESDQTITMVLADGSKVPAKLMTLKSVRVGKFTVENVDCAVMPENLRNAAPLLGGSFSKNFTYKIDPDGKKLTLSQIDAGGGPKTKPNPATPKAHKTSKSKSKKTTEPDE